MFRLLFLISILPLFVSAQTIFTLSKAEQAKVYCLVIAEYVKAVNKNEKFSYDTLYIGNHDEFPEIKLPETIQKKRIILHTYHEGEKEPQNKRSSSFINIMDIDK